MVNSNVLTFAVAAPYDVVYRNNSSIYPVAPHSHNGMELYLTLSHLPDVLLNGTVSEVPAGTLILIPPFCVHQLFHEINTVYERYILSINSHWLNEVFCGTANVFHSTKQSTSPLLLSLDATQKKELSKQLDALLSITDVSSPASLAGLFTFLATLDKMIEKLSPENSHAFPISDSQKMVNQMIAYIQEHIYENINVTDLANHFFLHPDYLSRLFKKHAHTTISSYISLEKITTAQQLLREGNTVNEVQERLNYSSYAYFFKTFQKTVGISPSKYRGEYVK